MAAEAPGVWVVHRALRKTAMVIVRRLIAFLMICVCGSAWAVVQPVATGSWVGSRTGVSYSDPFAGLAGEKANWDASFSGFVACRTYTDNPFTTNATLVSYSSTIGGCASGGLGVTANWVACPANAARVGDTCVCNAGTS